MELPALPARSGHQDKNVAIQLLTSLLEELWTQGQAREQLREVLCCETGGRFHLVEAGQMSAQGVLLLHQPIQGAHSTTALRAKLRALRRKLGLAEESLFELELAIGEVAGNVVKHAQQGCCDLYLSPSEVTVCICDNGPGILRENCINRCWSRASPPRSRWAWATRCS